MLAASLYFTLSWCQTLLFVVLLMEERLALRAVIAVLLVYGVGESCRSHWEC